MFTPRRMIVLGILVLLGGIFFRTQVQVSQAAAPAMSGFSSAPGSLAGIQFTLVPPLSGAPSFARLAWAPSACPGNNGGLPDTVERTNFCVYYDDNNGNPVNPGDPPAISATQAGQAADWVQDYWDTYVGFGFLAPKFSSKLEVQLTRNSGCNGGTSSGSNVFDTFTGCFSVNNIARQVLGHELFHRIQYSYDGGEVRWFKEGTARAMQDNVFADLDTWSGSLTFSFSFNSEVNNYLANTNRDITSDDMRYMSSLWWKYFSEHYGAVTTEPQRGVDAYIALWQAATSANDIAALNNALSNLGAGTNFDTAFRRFTVANITKDLTGVPDGSYAYIDEKEAGSPATYGPITPANGGTITPTTAANFNNQSITRYGAANFAVTPAANCQVVTVTFHRDSGTNAFYHVVTQKGSALARTVEGSGADWQQSFLNDGLTRVVAIAGSTASASQVDVSFSCATASLDVKLPNSGAVAHVGPAAGPGKFLAQVLVTNGSPTGPVVGGLTNADFKARVNGLNAVISGGGFIQEQYWLVVQAPNQAASGTYDLEVTLEAPGSSTPIISDTNTGSVAYDNDASDQVLVIDRSGSMADDGKLVAARDAGKLYVDISRTGDGLAVVPFNQDVSPAPLAMQASNAGVRTSAKSYIDGLTASGATSIGDGLQGAVNQRLSSPTGSPRCSFVLLSDGMENSSAYYANVKTAVQNIHCPVTAIAFGPDSSETLMQTIATDSGGIFFYNDVYASARPSPDGSAAPNAVDATSTNLQLSDTYEYAQARESSRQRLLQEDGVLVQTEQRHVVRVDGATSQMVFTLDWAGAAYPRLRLQKPDGTILDLPYDFSNFDSGFYVGYRIQNPEAGDWTMIVDWAPPIITRPEQATAGLPYQVMASGKSNLAVLLITPDRFGKAFFTGNRMPIYAVVTSSTPIPGLQIFAFVTAPGGAVTRLQLFDDGQHDDGVAGDNFYGNWYTLVTKTSVVTPIHDDLPPATPPLNEGGYRVQLEAKGGTLQRETLGSFAVQAGPDVNGNNLPDPWETETGQTNPSADPDLDQLVNLDEYLSGTNPLLSDTDGGGENDGSEVSDGENPLDPADDHIEAPEFLVTIPKNGAVRLEYDVKPGYTEELLYRATNPNGPWNVQVPELPATGVYTDTATNGTTYYYRLEAVNAAGHRSAIIDAGDATAPSSDPIPPQARVLINGGAAQTGSTHVTLSFAAYESEDLTPQQTFADITQMKISNDPFLTGAGWQSFAQNVPWTLALPPAGQPAKVYVQFRDAAGNVSTIEVGAILLSGTGTGTIYLPVITKHP